MGFLDRLFGADDTRRAPAPRTPAPSYRTAPGGAYAPPPAPGAASPAASAEDQQAIDRYRYLLRTAPPHAIEQVHAEAFARLTPAQRQQVLADLSSTLPPAERPASDDPNAMARAATRAEYLQPGYMERTFGNRSWRSDGAPGFGSMLGASILGTIGGYVIGSALVSAFLAPSFADEQGFTDGGDGAAAPDASGADAGGEWGGLGDLGGDFGGDFGF